MQQKEIPFSMPFIDDREIDEVVKVLKGKWITTGAEVRLFEDKIKEYLGVKTAVATSSATAAMNVCLAALGTGPGDDVLTTAYTFASTALSIIHCGAMPVFADVEKDTFNIDPDEMERVIQKDYLETPGGLKSKHTGRYLKGILPVHFGGQAAEMDRIEAIAHRHNLFIVEDAAHALGAKYKNQKIGKSANFVCYSFYSNKNLTTGEGGMIVTDRGDWEQKLRMYALHGLSKNAIQRYKTQLPFYDIQYPGFKANLTDIQAALGVVQVDKLPEIDARRNQICKWYDELLKDVEEITTPHIHEYNHSARHLYPILVDGKIKESRDDIIIKLREKGIYPSVHFIPVHYHTYFKEFFNEKIHLPVTEDLFHREISLPLFPELEYDDIKRVAETLETIIYSM